MESIKGIYIDLDSLFDTRLGTVAEINPALVPIALDQGHLTRNSDEYSFISTATYKSLYELRNSETLKLSPLTGCHKLLASAVVNMLKASIDSPDITGVKISVNIWPYKLTEKEIGDLLDLIVDKTGKLVQVEIIDVKFSDLTFKYCENKFDMLFIYDYMNFIENNIKAGNHKKSSLNDRMLIAPEIYLRSVSKEELNKVYKANPKVSGYTTADAIKSLASPVVMLELVEPSIFSVDIELYQSDFYKKKESTDSTT